jgi:hypothetical protein
MPESRDWKTVLEDDPFKTAEYSYSENVDARNFPNGEYPAIEGIPGEIHEIMVRKEEGKYSIQLTIFMDDLEGISEEEVTARLKVLGADPNTDWES